MDDYYYEEKIERTTFWRIRKTESMTVSFIEKKDRIIFILS